MNEEKNLQAIERVKSWKESIYSDNPTESCIIAQHDDCDYSESGYVVFYYDDLDRALIYGYGHCSCFSTATAIADANFTPSWIGTKHKLLKLAKNKLDFSLEGRPANSEDFDYDHLMNVYDQVLKYFVSND